MMKYAVMCFALLLASTAHAQDDATQIRQLISTTFDRPDATVLSEPIVVEGEYAIADWTQADKGGRALLHKKQEKWQISACAGDSLQSASGLSNAGIPMQTARLLAEKLQTAEQTVATERLVKMQHFRMDNKAIHRH